MHSLTAKEPDLCVHLYLMIICGLYNTEKPQAALKKFECDRRATVNLLVEKLNKFFPSYTSADRPAFMQHETNFTKTFCDKEEEILTFDEYFDQTYCEICNSDLQCWPHETKCSYLISCGILKIVKVTVKICPKCKVLFYPDIIQHGLLPLHNKGKLITIIHRFAILRVCEKNLYIV